MMTHTRGSRGLVLLLAMLVLVVFACAAQSATFVYRSAYQPSSGVSALAGEQMRWKSSVNSYEIPVLPVTAITAKIEHGVASPYTVSVGKLPKGAYVIGAIVAVTTAFDASSTNVLTVGTAADDDSLVDASDVTEGSIGTAAVFHRPAILSADTTYYLKYTQSGNAATHGVARVTIFYCVPAVN